MKPVVSFYFTIANLAATLIVVNGEKSNRCNQRSIASAQRKRTAVGRQKETVTFVDVYLFPAAVQGAGAFCDEQ